VKPSGIQRLLALALAVWLPFCCCHARAIAASVLGGQGTTAAASPDDRPACCRARVERAEAGPGSTAERPCPGEPCERCPSCLSTKDRAPSPEAPEIDLDTVGRPDPVVTALPGTHDELSCVGPDAETVGFRGAPPWRSAGRRALALHQTFVI